MKTSLTITSFTNFRATPLLMQTTGACTLSSVFLMEYWTSSHQEIKRVNCTLWTCLDHKRIAVVPKLHPHYYVWIPQWHFKSKTKQTSPYTHLKKKCIPKNHIHWPCMSHCKRRKILRMRNSAVAEFNWTATRTRSAYCSSVCFQNAQLSGLWKDEKPNCSKMHCFEMKI